MALFCSDGAAGASGQTGVKDGFGDDRVCLIQRRLLQVSQPPTQSKGDGVSLLEDKAFDAADCRRRERQAGSPSRLFMKKDILDMWHATGCYPESKGLVGLLSLGGNFCLTTVSSCVLCERPYSSVSD